MTDELQYKKYDESEYEIVENLLLKDKKTSEDLFYALKNEPETITIVYLNDKLVAMLQIVFGDDTSYLTIFVSPDFRNQGIGHNILNYVEDMLEQIQTKEIVTAYLIDNEASRHFAIKNGYEKYFVSSCIKYKGERFDIKDLPIRQYCNNDYSQAFNLNANAFFNMLSSVENLADTTVEQPSEESRRAWLDNASNSYVYIHNGEIVGYACIEENEISTISVRTDLQGHGIGRNLIKYLCNIIYDKGYNEVIVWCVEGNPARFLYNSIGFKESYTQEYGHKYNM